MLLCKTEGYDLSFYKFISMYYVFEKEKGAFTGTRQATKRHATITRFRGVDKQQKQTWSLNETVAGSAPIQPA